MKGFKRYGLNVIYEHSVWKCTFCKVTNVKRIAIVDETTKVLGGHVHPVKKVCERRPLPFTPDYNPAQWWGSVPSVQVVSSNPILADS